MYLPSALRLQLYRICRAWGDFANVMRIKSMYTLCYSCLDTRFAIVHWIE